MLSQQFISIIADGAVVPVVLIGVIALLLYVPTPEKYTVYCRVLLAGLTAYVIAKIAGTIYQPTELRPFELLGLAPGASYLNNPGFPSDHALFCMTITLAVMFEVRKRWLTITLLSFTLIVCVGRVLALVHTPVDVIGGVIIACLGGIWYLSAQRFDLSYNRRSSKRRKSVV